MNDPVPCKVCGATPDVVGTPVENCDVFDYFVRCSNDACGYCPTIVDKERAIAIWNDNNSTAPAPLATARECAKKIHDRLTWYPNDNTVDVIAAIVTCYIPTASPSDAEQLIELRKLAQTSLDLLNDVYNSRASQRFSAIGLSRIQSHIKELGKLLNPAIRGKD